MNTSYGSYEIVFNHLEDIKKKSNFTVIQQTMRDTIELSEPIAKLKEIVMDKEDYNYRTITTT